MATATKTKAGAGSGTGEDQDADGGGKRKKLLLVVVPLLLAVVGAAVWFLVLAPRSAAAAGEEEHPEPVAGEVLALDPISVNLAEDHYLRVGLALQFTEDAASGHGTLDGSKALDAAIATFSGQSQATLADPAQRDALKAQLLEKVSHDYHDTVMEVYFTEFVTQ